MNWFFIRSYHIKLFNKFYLVLGKDADEPVYGVSTDFINKLTGRIQRTITHIVPSTSPRSPFTLNE